MQQGVVVIPKTVSHSRLVENINATKLTLDELDIAKLRKLDTGFRLYKVWHEYDVGQYAMQKYEGTENYGVKERGMSLE